MDECIFCKIASGKIGGTPLHENSVAVVVKDINPMAPHHVIAIAKDHVDSMANLGWSHWGATLPGMLALLDDYAQANKLHESGYRIIINTGNDAGQTVKHFHIHLLGGAPLKNDFGA